jgi:hypothetical protein
MVYVVETSKLSVEVRADPCLGKWLQESNSLVPERNPAVKSLNVHAAYIDAFEMGMVWHAALLCSPPKRRDCQGHVSES